MKIRYDENGIHLFNRKSGANILIDELTVPKEKWSKAPRHVSFALTNVCDLKCAYCYAPKDKSELRMEDLKNWITEIDRYGSIGVGFGGGEPTLYPKFTELCQFAAANTDLSVSFTTHGHRITAAMAEQLKGNIHFIRVSVDGLNETYEKLRGRSFSGLLSHMELIGSIAPFGVNYVLNADTLPDLSEAVSYWEQFGATEFLILPEIDFTGSISTNLLGNLRTFLSDYSGKLPLRINENCSEDMPVALPFHDSDSLQAYAFVDAKGRLRGTNYQHDGIDICGRSLVDNLEKMRNYLAKLI